MPGQVTKKNRIFISYRREDNRAMADHIYHELVRRFGERAVFKDVDKLHPGHKFKDKLDEIIDKCDVALVVIGDRWAGKEREEGRSRLHDPNDYVRKEVEALLKRHIPIIPLIIEGASVPKVESLPDDLRELIEWQALNIHYDPYFQVDMGRLTGYLMKLMKEGGTEGSPPRSFLPESLRRLFRARPATPQPGAAESAPPPPDIQEQRATAGASAGWYVYPLSVLAGSLLTAAVFLAAVFLTRLGYGGYKFLPAALVGLSIVFAHGLLGWMFGVCWPRTGWKLGLWVSVVPVALLAAYMYWMVQSWYTPPGMEAVIWGLIFACAFLLAPVVACVGAGLGARRAGRRP